MAEVIVRYFGMLREIVGRRQETVRIEDGLSAEALISKLSEKHGQRFTGFVFDSKGRLRSGLAFAINGDSVPASKLSRTQCRNIQEFVILPPISGGMTEPKSIEFFADSWMSASQNGS